MNDKTEADRWHSVQLLARAEDLSEPEGHEVFLDELMGMRVSDEPHGELGTIANWYELPQGLVLEVRGEKWKADIPFNEAFVKSVDREARSIAVELPEGLVEPTITSNLPPRTQPQA